MTVKDMLWKISLTMSDYENLQATRCLQACRP
jgi:hypothetical protein